MQCNANWSARQASDSEKIGTRLWFSELGRWLQSLHDCLRQQKNSSWHGDIVTTNANKLLICNVGHRKHGEDEYVALNGGRIH